MSHRWLRVLHALLRVWLGLLLLAWPSTALASCSMSTILLPDGRMVMCTTCCLPGGFCQTMCQ